MLGAIWYAYALSYDSKTKKFNDPKAPRFLNLIENSAWFGATVGTGLFLAKEVGLRGVIQQLPSSLIMGAGAGLVAIPVIALKNWWLQRNPSSTSSWCAFRIKQIEFVENVSEGSLRAATLMVATALAIYLLQKHDVITLRTLTREDYIQVGKTLLGVAGGWISIWGSSWLWLLPGQFSFTRSSLLNTVRAHTVGARWTDEENEHVRRVLSAIENSALFGVTVGTGLLLARKVGITGIMHQFPSSLVMGVGAGLVAISLITLKNRWRAHQEFGGPEIRERISQGTITASEVRQAREIIRERFSRWETLIEGALLRVTALLVATAWSVYLLQKHEGSALKILGALAASTGSKT
jgi:hypothetical protein